MVLGSRLSRIVLMIRQGEVARAVDFYHGALGLGLRRMTDEWAELNLLGDPLSGGGGVTLHLQACDAEAQLSTGYSPILNIEVQDMASVVSECIQKGAHLDGPIQYPAHGKVACLRAPDGHMIGLYEPNL